MSTDLIDFTKSAQEQVLSGLASLQETALEAYRTVATSVAGAVPAVPVSSIPGADLVPDPAAAVELTFGFVEKLVAGQRRFVEDIVATSVAPKSATIKK